MAVLLPDTLKTMTDNFPAAEAKDVEITLTGGTKKRLQRAYDDGDLGGGGGVQIVDELPATPTADMIVIYNGVDTALYRKGKMYQYRENDFTDPYYCYESEHGYLYLMDDPATTSSTVYYSEGDNPPQEVADIVEWNELVITAVNDNEITLDDNGNTFAAYRYSDYDVTAGGSWVDLSDLKIYSVNSWETADLQAVVPHISDPFFVITVGYDSMLGTTGYAHGPGVDVPWTVWTLRGAGGFMVCDNNNGFHSNYYQYMIDGETYLPYLELLDAGKTYSDSGYYREFILNLQRYVGLWGGMYQFDRMNRFDGTNASETMHFAFNNYDYPMVGFEVYFDDNSGEASCCYLAGKVTAVDAGNNEFTVTTNDGRTWTCDSTAIVQDEAILPVYEAQGFPYVLDEMPSTNSFPAGFKFVYNGKTYTTQDSNPETFKHGHTYELTYSNNNYKWEEAESDDGVTTVRSIKSLSEIPPASEIPENLDNGTVLILAYDDNDVKAGTMYAIGAMEAPTAVASVYHYKFTNGIKTIYSSASTIGENPVYVQSDKGYLFTALVNLGGNTYRPELYKNDSSGIWDFNVNLPSTDEAVPTIAGWVALNEDTTTELAEQALAVASTAALQAKEAKDAITPHFTGTRNEVNAQIAQNKLPDGAYVAVTDDIDQDYDTDYSTNEVKLANRWIDGKPIYRKVVDFGALPNADTKTVAHNISNVDTFIYVNGVAKKADHTAIPVNYINPTAINNSIGLYVDSTNVTIITTNDLRDYANTYVFLEYTKSTD